jgi:hypothetical protein
MNISSNMPQYQRSWFTDFEKIPGSNRGVMTIKSEHLKDFEACCKERARIFKEAEASLPKRPMEVKLTDEQKKYLSETYDRTDMSVEEYHAFANDLYEFGILNDQDLKDMRIRTNELVPLEDGYSDKVVLRSSSYRTNKIYLPFNYYGGGNVLDWARYQASFRLYDSETQTHIHDRISRLFTRLCSVLEQM